MLKPASATVPAVPKKRGRPKKGEVRPEAPPKRLELQPHRSLAENLADLPQPCDIGCKKNSKGHTEHWIGYKLHLDVMDGDIPVSAILTSASVHDSQVAIPLAQMSAPRVRALYELMDAAYDAPAIHEFVRGLGHVPIIDPNPRGGERIPLDPAQEQRFKERSAAERVNSNLKDNFGGRFVRVRGAAKVMAPSDVWAHCPDGLPVLPTIVLNPRPTSPARDCRLSGAGAVVCPAPARAGAAGLRFAWWDRVSSTKMGSNT